MFETSMNTIFRLAKNCVLAFLFFPNRFTAQVSNDTHNPNQPWKMTWKRSCFCVQEIDVDVW